MHHAVDAGIGLTGGRDVDYTFNRTVASKDGCGQAGKALRGSPVMLGAGDDDGFTDAKARANAIGALGVFSPDRTGDHARSRQITKILVITAEQHHGPLRRGERNKIFAVHQFAEQTFNLWFGDAQEFFAFLHQRLDFRVA